MEWGPIAGGLCVWVWAAGLGLCAAYALLGSGFHALFLARRRLREDRRRPAFRLALAAVAVGAAWQVAAAGFFWETAGGERNPEEVLLLGFLATLALPLPAGLWVLGRLWWGRGEAPAGEPDGGH